MTTIQQSAPGTDHVDQLLRATHTRRAFLRLSLALGLAAPSIGWLLAACGGDDDDDDEEPTAPPATTASPAGDGPTPTSAATTAATSAATQPAATEPPAGVTATTTGSEPPSGGQAVFRWVDEPASLFSGSVGGTRDLWVQSFIANGLTRLRYPELDIVDDLAESWEVSEDGLSYSFTLHDGVLWHDGEPFTAGDMQFSFELWAHPEWPGPLDANTIVIEGASAYKEGQADTISGLVIPDDTHVEFTLTQPHALFLSALAVYFRPLPRHILEGVSPADATQHEFARMPVYTGPFRLTQWNSGESMTFEAFDEHFAGRPQLDSVVIRIIGDPATALADLQTGGVHLTDVTADQFASMEGEDGLQALELTGAFDWHLQFDLTLPQFSDVRVRHAMYHAIDRPTIAEALLGGRADLTWVIASPLSWLYNPDVPTFEYDPDAAKALLDEAGWLPGSDGIREKDGQRLEFSMLTISRTNEWALAVLSYLEEVGITFEVEQAEFGTWIGQVYGQGIGAYQATVGGFPVNTLDPRLDLQGNYLSPRPGVDSTGYQNAEVDALFAQAQATTDLEEQRDLYGQIQELVAADAVYVHLWQPNDLLLVREELTIPDVQTMAELFQRLPEWEVRS